MGNYTVMRVIHRPSCQRAIGGPPPPSLLRSHLQPNPSCLTRFAKLSACLPVGPALVIDVSITMIYTHVLHGGGKRREESRR